MRSTQALLDVGRWNCWNSERFLRVHCTGNRWHRAVNKYRESWIIIYIVRYCYVFLWVSMLMDWDQSLWDANFFFKLVHVFFFLRSAIDTARFIEHTLLTHVRHLVNDESFFVTTPKVRDAIPPRVCSTAILAAFKTPLVPSVVFLPTINNSLS